MELTGREYSDHSIAVTINRVNNLPESAYDLVWFLSGRVQSFDFNMKYLQRQMGNMLGLFKVVHPSETYVTQFAFLSFSCFVCACFCLSMLLFLELAVRLLSAYTDK